MNDMIHFELQNRKAGIFSGKYALFFPFNPHFCAMNPLNMQKRNTQILYQYLSTKVVEVGGIEPPSESLLTSFSPSAATILGFPSPVASRRAAGYGSFMITGNASKLWRARSPHS